MISKSRGSNFTVASKLPFLKILFIVLIYKIYGKMFKSWNYRQDFFYPYSLVTLYIHLRDNLLIGDINAYKNVNTRETCRLHHRKSILRSY